jgi:X-X-X-Leu-X-X-Gly heptad repeat protein
MANQAKKLATGSNKLQSKSKANDHNKLVLKPLQM